MLLLSKSHVTLQRKPLVSVLDRPRGISPKEGGVSLYHLLMIMEFLRVLTPPVQGLHLLWQLLGWQKLWYVDGPRGIQIVVVVLIQIKRILRPRIL